MSACMEPGLDILDAIDRAALMKKGTLRAWMVTHHDAFKARLKTRKPDWITLAKVFADGGLLDARGKTPNAEVARKTWYRVQDDVAKAGQPAAVEPPQATRSQPPQADDAPASRPRNQFQLATVRRSPPKEP
jgi:hypothetical protein